MATEGELYNPLDLPADYDRSMNEEETYVYKQILAFEKEQEATAESYDSWCDEVEDFILGNHYGFDQEDDERTLEGGEYPIVHHTFELIDKQTAALTRFQTRAKLLAEDAANFSALPPGHPYMQMANDVREGLNQRLTDNEIFAEVMTARMDTARKRGKFDAIFDEAAEMAAWYRYAYVLTRFENGNEDEGAQIDLLDVCDVRVDRRAPGNIEKGRIAGYRIRRTAKWCEKRFGYKPKLAPEGVSSVSHRDGGMGYADQTDYSYADEKVLPEDKLLDVWVYFVEDHTMVENEIEVVSEEIMVDALGNQMIDPRTGEPMMRREMVKETEMVPKWNGGWKMCFKFQRRVYNIQDNPNPSGKLPLKRFAWYPTPRRMRGLSLYDLNKDMNQAINHSFKYALEGANRSQPKVLYKSHAIENIEDALDNEAYGFIEIDPDEPLTDVFMIIPANPITEPHIGLGKTFMETQDKSLGAVDQRAPGKTPHHITGDAIEGLNGPDADRHDKRMRRWLRFKQEIYTDLIWLILEYEDMDRTVVLGRDWGNPTYITLEPGLFDFEEYEFYARWDVEMRQPDDLPANRAKRNSAKLEVAQLLMSMPPQRGLMMLRFLDLEDEPALRVMLEEELQMMAQQPQEPGPIEIAQQEAQIELEKEKALLGLKAQQRAAEAISDAMEHLAKKHADNDDQDAALFVLSLLPQAVQEALEGITVAQNQAFQQAMAGQQAPNMQVIQGGMAPGPLVPPQPM